MITKHLKYLRYVLVHKYFVLKAGRMLGLGWKQLLVHDLSKFSPAEWGPYAEKFYGDPKLSVDEVFGDNRLELLGQNYRFKEDVRAAFDEAWAHHIRHNPHHWNRWFGNGCVLEMPEGFALEMVADWIGAGRAIKGKEWTPDEALTWYESQKNKIGLHPATRSLVERTLRVLVQDIKRRGGI